jgi:hypothetical protein
VRRVLFAALAFMVLLHFVEVAATRRTQRVERPCAFGAGPSLHARRFDPYQLSHKSFLGLVRFSRVQQFLLTVKMR